jgi:hypothetical protein
MDLNGDGFVGNPPANIPRINLAAGESKNEGNSGTTPFNFTVNLSIPALQEIRLSYNTSNGTALAGSDYIATTGTLIIPAGATSGVITVPVIGDTIGETNETFNVTISNPTYGIIDTANSTATIINDDAIQVTPVESFGNTALVRDTNDRLYAQTGTGNPVPITNNGQQIHTAIYGGWQTLAAETVNGANQVLWKNLSGNYLHLWHTNSNWQWQRSEGEWSFNSQQAYSLETNFSMDLNGDGFVGNPITSGLSSNFNTLNTSNLYPQDVTNLFVESTNIV